MIIPNKFNGYNRDGTRQYHKGGDGGAGEARKQEEQRQARVQAAVDTINGIFDGKPVRSGQGQSRNFDPSRTYYDARGNVVWTPRQPAAPAAPAPTTTTNGLLGGRVLGTLTGEQAAPAPAEPSASRSLFGTAITGLVDPDVKRMRELAASGGLFEGYDESPGGMDRNTMYQNQKEAVLDLNKRDIDRQYTQAERQNRFGLARAGLMGGSADIDSNAELQEKTSEGLIKAAALADGAAADLKTQDERTRQSLISMAQSGIDTGTAQTMALRGLDANAQAAQGARQGAMVGNLFNDMSQAYLMRQMGAGMNAGRNQNQQWYGVSAPQQTYAGNVT